MIDERNRLICDCCGRQIVKYRTADTNEFSIGPAEVMILGPNKHACRVCSKVEQEFDEEPILDDGPSPEKDCRRKFICSLCDCMCNLTIRGDKIPVECVLNDGRFRNAAEWEPDE